MIFYLQNNAPPISSVLMKNEDPAWKEFVTRASLRYVLQILAGLAVDHPPTQLLVARHCIPVLHQVRTRVFLISSVTEPNRTELKFLI